MEDRHYRRSDSMWKYLFGGACIVLMVLVQIMYSSNMDYVKRVDARCNQLEETKVDRKDFDRLEKYLIRIEDKLDRHERRSTR